VETTGNVTSAGLDQPEQPAHPVSALTTAELTRYRRELERSLDCIPVDAPVHALLQTRLAEVTEEQEMRVRSEQASRKRHSWDRASAADQASSA
jgi:hypothetical protein